MHTQAETRGNALSADAFGEPPVAEGRRAEGEGEAGGGLAGQEPDEGNDVGAQCIWSIAIGTDLGLPRSPCMYLGKGARLSKPSRTAANRKTRTLLG